MAFKLDVVYWEKKWNIGLKDVGNDFYCATECPFCGKANKFYVNVKGYYHCKAANNCGVEGHVMELLKDKGSYSPHKQNESSTLNLNIVNEQFKKDVFACQDALDYLTKERKLLPETIADIEIGYCKEKGAITFPIYRGREIISFRFKCKDSGRIWNYPEDAFKNTRYGTFLGHFIYTNKTVIVTEGEYDTATLIQYGFDNVLCMKGANCNDPVLNKILEIAPQVFFIGDQDEAGQKGIQVWAEKYGFDKCFNVVLPEKDVNDCLKKGMTQEELLKLIKARKHVEIPGIKSVRKVKADLLKNPLYPILKFPIRSIDNILGGLYASEATIISGDSGVGKTAFVSALGEKLASNGIPVVMSSLESDSKFITAKYLKDFQSLDNFHFFDPEDYKLFYNFKRMTKYFAGMIRQFNMKLFMLDHIEWLTDYFKGEPIKAPSALVKVLISASKEAERITGKKMHLFLLHHINKTPLIEGKHGKIRTKRPDKNSLSYGGTREAANIIFLHREYDNEKQQLDDSGSVEIIIAKSRAKGELGSGFAFYDKELGRYVLEKDEVEILQNIQNVKEKGKNEV